MKSFLKIVFLLIVFSFTISRCFAMLPPEVYEQMIKESKIKAIATVKKVKIIKKNKYTIEERVFFHLEKAMDKTNVPDEFSGLCKSVRKNQMRLIGSDVHFYPLKNDRVFVTITTEGGSITSYTTLTPELEDKVNKNFDEMKFGINEIYFD